MNNTTPNSKNVTDVSNIQLTSLWDNFNKYNPGSLDKNNKKDKVTQSKPSKKRKLDDKFCLPPNEKQNEQIDKQINEYVSASTVKNYLLQDPILDWFEEYGGGKKRKYSNLSDDQNVNQSKQSKQFNQPNQSNKGDKKNPLFEGGINFENKINEHLRHKFGPNLIEINTQGRGGCTRDNADRTISAMITGYHVILQGVVFNDFNKTNGTFDLIVRSDCVNNLFARQVLDDELVTLKAPKLSGNYHYIVIDIKWTTMTLCANGYTIRNDGRFPSYKGQLAIYNCAIGNIQGYIPPKAYIMAKAWKIDKKNDYKEGYNSFDLLGEIDYSEFDYKYINSTIDALGWVRTVRKFGDTWDLYNPTVSEMYPNCSNKLDSPWTKEKQEVADRIGELTNIWHVTVKHRQNAHVHGIKSWKDPRCNSKIMGFTTDGRAKVVDALLDINRSDTNVISPAIIQNNEFVWQTPGPTDFYIDFETANCCFHNPQLDIKNTKTEPDMVFMIGVGHIENNEFVYKVFYTNDLSLKEEERMFDEFSKYLVQKIKQLDPNLEYTPRLFHWGFAEQANVNHVNDRHLDKYVKLFGFCQWVDMYKIFISEPIVVKGSLDFKLKHIGKAMHKHGLVATLWDDNGPSDGLGAMLSAIECYQNNKIQSPEYQLIIDYNKIDCKILWEMLCYLRQNHCQNM